MYIMYLFFALFPLLPQLAKAHDPRNRLYDLIALPHPDQCQSICQAIQASNCQDDTCACAYSAKAEACVQCMATSESVEKYNNYLGACASIGKVAPSTTHAVQPYLAPTESQPQLSSSVIVSGGQFTDITAALGVETQASGSADLEHPSSLASLIPSAPGVIPISVYRGLGSQTQQAGATSASPSTLNSNLPAPLNGAISDGDNVSDTHGISVLNDTTAPPRVPPAMDAGTTALNSSRNFFSQAISQACVRHCVTWKIRADSCSDDRCLCTSDVIYTAGVCSDCVGDSGRGGQIGTCYSEFKDACEIATVGTTAQIAPPVGQGALTDQLYPSDFAISAGAGTAGITSGLPYGYGPAGGNAGTGTGQIRPMLVTDTSGVTYSVTGTALTTQIVTATAGALIAQETVVVDAGAGCLKASMFSVIAGSLIGLAVMAM